jgi:hypothetical protein
VDGDHAPRRPVDDDRRADPADDSGLPSGLRDGAGQSRVVGDCRGATGAEHGLERAQAVERPTAADRERVLAPRRDHHERLGGVVPHDADPRAAEDACDLFRDGVEDLRRRRTPGHEHRHVPQCGFLGREDMLPLGRRLVRRAGQTSRLTTGRGPCPIELRRTDEPVREREEHELGTRLLGSSPASRTPTRRRSCRGRQSR